MPRSRRRRRQDIGWFDEHPAGELPSAVTSAMAKIQDGVGRKVRAFCPDCFVLKKKTSPVSEQMSPVLKEEAQVKEQT